MGYVLLLLLFPWLGVMLVISALPLFFRFLVMSLFEGFPSQRLVAAERRVAVQEVIVVNSIISNAQTSEGSVSECADFTVCLIHEQIGEAIGEAVVKHTPHPMAHVSLFCTAHGVNSVFSVSASPVLRPLHFCVPCGYQHQQPLVRINLLCYGSFMLRVKVRSTVDSRVMHKSFVKSNNPVVYNQSESSLQIHAQMHLSGESLSSEGTKIDTQVSVAKLSSNTGRS